MTRAFKTLDRASFASGTRVLAVCDFNVPIEGEKMTDDFRIMRSRKTLDFLRERGAHTLLVSHRSGEGESLVPVFDYLKGRLPVSFARTIVDARAALERAEEGTFVLLENIRTVDGAREVGNDSGFARELAGLAEVYVNEAFSASHRAYTSIVGVPLLLPSYAGFTFAEEVEHLSRVFTPPHPFLAIVGGAKFETKLPLVEKLLTLADTVYLCGALANDVYKARGEDVGASLISSLSLPPSVVRNRRLRVPSSVARRGGKIVDAGHEAIAELKDVAAGAKLVVWNGPLGEYTGEDYGPATDALAHTLAESNAETIVGGGDTLAVISRLGLREKFSFVSTGGGAMLQFLATGTLPGIEALTGRL